MNSWRFNSNANYWLRWIIAKGLGISYDNVYKKVKDVVRVPGDRFHFIVDDGKVYELTFKEVSNEGTSN